MKTKATDRPSVLRPYMDDKNKVQKPMIERRRRAKMNELVNQTRMLIQTSVLEKGTHGRMERAEILEQAVQHIKQRQENPVLDKSTLVKESFSAGFQDCMNEVLSCLNGNEDAELRATLSGFGADMLERRLASDNVQAPPSAPPATQQHPGPSPLYSAAATAGYPSPAKEMSYLDLPHTRPSARSLLPSVENIYGEQSASDAYLRSSLARYPPLLSPYPMPSRHVRDTPLYQHPTPTLYSPPAPPTSSSLTSAYVPPYRMYPFRTSPLQLP